MNLLEKFYTDFFMSNSLNWLNPKILATALYKENISVFNCA